MQPTLGTLVPVVADALLARWRVLFSTWAVYDGPFGVPAGLVDAQALIVGVGNDENADPFRTEEDGFDMRGRRHEFGTIRCQAAVNSGDNFDGKAARDVVAGLLAAVDSDLRSDPSLSGIADRVRLGAMRWAHLAGEGYAVTAVHFDVLFDGWL